MDKISLLLLATAATTGTASLLPQARGEVLCELARDPAQFFVLNFGAVSAATT